jgi:hypothetical protein
VIVRYDDDDWDFERDGWALGLRGGKTWPIHGGPWLIGFELLADLAFFERTPVESERPLVWSYRLRLVFAR